MEVLVKLEGNDDLSLISPEDGEQTDEADSDMNHLPPHLLRAHVEVNLKSDYYDFEDADEKEASTLQLSEEQDSSLPSHKKRQKL